METKVIVVLAKSAKKNNFCVAGLDVATKKFIRPISNDPKIEDAVSSDALIYSDGTAIQLFDGVKIQFEDRVVNNTIQPENFYYNANYRWEKFAVSSLEKIIKWRGFDSSKYVFYNTERYIDPVYIRYVENHQSLLLLPVKHLKIQVKVHDNGYKQYFANFEYNDKQYLRFGVGDIEVRNIFKNLSGGEYPFKNEAAVLFSLTNPFRDNRCYKMIAQVF